MPISSSTECNGGRTGAIRGVRRPTSAQRMNVAVHSGMWWPLVDLTWRNGAVAMGSTTANEYAGSRPPAENLRELTDVSPASVQWARTQVETHPEEGSPMLRAPQTVIDEASPATNRMLELYDAHAKAVYHFLLRLTYGERQAAEDLTQETMLRAWRNIAGLDADIAILRPWLLTVARRLAIDAGRAKRARPSEVGDIDLAILSSPDDTIDRMLDAEIIKEALQQLSPEHRNVIIEVYYNGRSVAETAEFLGIPAGTVKSRAYYALRLLRRALGSRVPPC